MVIILDNAKYHHAIAIQSFLEIHRDTLSLEFLPPYSPELNPIERIWKLIRKLCTHNHYFETLDELTQTVSHQILLWKQPNTTLSKLCCIT